MPDNESAIKQANGKAKALTVNNENRTASIGIELRRTGLRDTNHADLVLTKAQLGVGIQFCPLDDADVVGQQVEWSECIPVGTPAESGRLSVGLDDYTFRLTFDLSEVDLNLLLELANKAISFSAVLLGRAGEDE